MSIQGLGCFNMTLTLYSNLPITVVAGVIYKPNSIGHEVYDMSVVALPERKITLMVPHKYEGLSYRFFGYLSSKDKGPTVKKTGPVEDLLKLTDFWL